MLPSGAGLGTQASQDRPVSGDGGRLSNVEEQNS